MSSDKPNSFKGFLAKRPLLVFVWSVAPILAIFGVTMMNPTLDSTQIIGEQSLLELSMAQLASVVIMLVIPALLIAYLYRGNVFAFFNLTVRPQASHLVLATVLIVSANFFLNYLMELNALIPVGKNFANKFQQLQDSTSQTQAFFLNFGRFSDHGHFSSISRGIILSWTTHGATSRSKNICFSRHLPFHPALCHDALSILLPIAIAFHGSTIGLCLLSHKKPVA
jgi:hypothetical protein